MTRTVGLGRPREAGQPAPGRAPKREMEAFNRSRPPKPDPDAIADFAWSELTCRGCGSEPRSACIGERKPWMTVCAERYTDAAIAMKDAYNRVYPSWPRLENEACAEIAAELGIDPGAVGWIEVTTRVRERVAERSR